MGHFQRLLNQAVKDEKNTSLNKTGWATRHRSALTTPRRGTEKALVVMLIGWAEWADTVHGPIGHDHYVGREWMAIASALCRLLSADVGERIDCGSIDGWLRETATREGVDLETEEIGQEVPS